MPYMHIMDCLEDRRALYPVSHIYIPFLLYYLIPKFYFVFFLAAVWEVLEYTIFHLFGNYGLFPGIGETTCDVVILDLGNGLLGILLAYIIYWRGQEPRFQPIQMSLWKWICALIFGLLWSVISPLDYECEYWMFDCSHFHYWGVILLCILLAIYMFIMHRVHEYETLRYVTLTPVPKPYLFLTCIGFVFLLSTIIPLSVPLMIYIVTGVILIGFYVLKCMGYFT